MYVQLILFSYPVTKDCDLTTKIYVYFVKSLNIQLVLCFI